MGPFPLSEVNRQLAAGSLLLTDLAWYEGIPAWVPLSQVPGVSSTAPATGVAAAVAALAPGTAYAGFWIRLVAYIIDAFILCVLVALLNVALGPIRGNPNSGHSFLLVVLTLALETAYFGGLWSSVLQATLGQRVCGLKVVSAADLSRISFGRAVGRFFGMWLSGLILFIGFLMIAFTDRKQGLHDVIAGTFVVKS